MAFKNGYEIDTAFVNSNSDANGVMRFINPFTILYVSPSITDVYSLSIDFKAKPGKLVLKSVDGI